LKADGKSDYTIKEKAVREGEEMQTRHSSVSFLYNKVGNVPKN